MINEKHEKILKLAQSIKKELEAIKFIEKLKIDSKIIDEAHTIQTFFP